MILILLHLCIPIMSCKEYMNNLWYVVLAWANYLNNFYGTLEISVLFILIMLGSWDCMFPVRQDPFTFRTKILFSYFLCLLQR